MKLSEKRPVFRVRKSHAPYSDLSSSLAYNTELPYPPISRVGTRDGLIPI